MSDLEFTGLGFEIAAENKSALSALDDILERLKELKSAVNDATASRVSSIARSLQEFKNISPQDANNLDKIASALTKLNGLTIPKSIGSGLKSIADAARGLSDADINRIRSLAEATTGFSALRGVSAGAIRASRNGGSMSGTASSAGGESMLGDHLADITERARDANESLEEFNRLRAMALGGGRGRSFAPKLSEQQFFARENEWLPRTGDLAGMFSSPAPLLLTYSGMNTPLLTNGGESARRSISGVFGGYAGHQITGMFGGFGPVSTASPSRSGGFSSLLRSKPVPPPIFSDEADKNSASTVAQGVFGQLKGAGDALSSLKGGLSSVTAVFTAIYNGAKKAYNAIDPVVKKTEQFLGALSKATLNYLVGGIKNFTSAVAGLGHQIARVAMYRLLRTMIKDVGEGFTTGIQNLYQWSLAVDQSFSNAMNTVATSSLYMKNSVAAMVSPLLEYLAPALDFIVDKVVAAFNIINQLLAMLTGKGYWTKATKQATQFAKAADSGLGSSGGKAKDLAKELNLVIASFDELHLLAKTNDSSSGSGGGSGKSGKDTPDYGGMFENVAFDDTLKNLIDSNDWFGVGELFASKLNVVMENADKWIKNKFEPWAKTWAGRLGNMLNGFIAKFDWTLLGKTVADGLMAIVRAVNTWYTTVNWFDLGAGIGTAVRSWFENINWTEVAQMFANKINSVIYMAAGFVSSSLTNGYGFGTGIGDTIRSWFENIDWNALAETLVDGIQWAVDALTGLLNNNEMWTSIQNAFDTVMGGLEKIDWKDAAQKVSDLILKVVNAIDWVEIGRIIGEVKGKIAVGMMIAKLTTHGQMIRGFFGGAVESLFGFTEEKVNEELPKTIDRGGMTTDQLLANALLGNKTTAETGVQSIVDTTSSGMSDMYSNIEYWLTETSTTADTKTKEVATTVGTNLDSGWKAAADGAAAGVGGFKDAADTALVGKGVRDIGSAEGRHINDNLLDGFKLKGIRDRVAGAKRSITDALTGNSFSNVADSASVDIRAAIERAFDLTSTLSQKISSLVADIKYRMSGILNSVNMGTPYATMPTYNSTASNGKVSFYNAGYQVMASGGAMQEGEFYLAREAGPELIGRVGGSSAVMNNDQIVAAVATGVAQAVSSVVGGAQEIHVDVDGKELFDIMVSRNNETVAMTGASPLLV